jgi:hypothetical protein
MSTDCASDCSDDIEKSTADDGETNMTVSPALTRFGKTTRLCNARAAATSLAKLLGVQHTADPEQPPAPDALYSCGRRESHVSAQMPGRPLSPAHAGTQHRTLLANGPHPATAPATDENQLPPH